MSSAQTMALLEAYGVVPVIRTRSLERARDAVRALFDAGFRTFEVTLTVPGALALVEALASQDGVLVGTGTVLSLKEAQACLEAGSRYLVSPCLLKGLPEVCQEAQVPCIMSGLTPTEVFTASQWGATAVKLFPAVSMGGPAHLKALKAVFPAIKFVPTGGVNLETMVAYFRAGASFVGVGSDLFKRDDLEAKRYDEVIRQSQAYLATFQSYKEEA